jgi:methionine-rich copper-binding protein CopC
VPLVLVRDRDPALAASLPLLRGVLLALLTALLALAGAGPAQAHDVLIGTAPADGAVLNTPPTQVRLTFAEQALSIGTRMRVTGPGGIVVSTAPVQVVGSHVTQPLAPALPRGGYTVLWRVTSADGHPVSGSFTFTVSASAAGARAVAPASASVAGRQGWSAARIGVIVAAVLAVVLVAVAAMVLLVRRAGRPPPPPPSASAPSSSPPSPSP